MEWLGVVRKVSITSCDCFVSFNFLAVWLQILRQVWLNQQVLILIQTYLTLKIVFYEFRFFMGVARIFWKGQKELYYLCILCHLEQARSKLVRGTLRKVSWGLNAKFSTQKVFAKKFEHACRIKGPLVLSQRVSNLSDLRQNYLILKLMLWLNAFIPITCRFGWLICSLIWRLAEIIKLRHNMRLLLRNSKFYGYFLIE
jgi:hypothetical protein